MKDNRKQTIEIIDSLINGSINLPIIVDSLKIIKNDFELLNKDRQLLINENDKLKEENKNLALELEKLEDEKLEMLQIIAGIKTIKGDIKYEFKEIEKNTLIKKKEK